MKVHLLGFCCTCENPCLTFCPFLPPEEKMKAVTTVLFVENDAVALTMYQKRLQREGFHVEIAEDGIAALKVLSEMTPDIVVLDLMLPKFSGKDVFDYMRADAQFSQVPVIIFSNAPKTDWPQDPEASPTRALPQSEANFAALLGLIREMTAAAANIPAIVPEPEPALILQTANATSTAAVSAGAVNEPSATETTGQFLEYAIADMPVLREQCLAFIKAPSTDAGRNNLSALRQRLNTLNIGAQKTGCARLGLLGGAWEALLAEIERKPAIASPSILQTLAQAADCLRILLNSNNINSTESLAKAKALSVDDDEICNHVAMSALQRANIGADSVQDANAALELLKQNNYDVVLLDINMPGLTGFELCEKLRAMPHHAKTPVIFVTAFNNFENRKQSVLSGGGDLIAKPVSPLELALKVTIHLLKAPPKPVVKPATDAQGETALVWKEPAQKISHDTEMFLKGINKINATPGLVASTTETSTTDPEIVEQETLAPEHKPEPIAISQAKPIAVPQAKAVAVPQEVLQTAAAIPTGALSGLKMGTVESKFIESKPVESKAVEPKIPALKIAEPSVPAPKIAEPKIAAPKVVEPSPNVVNPTPAVVEAKVVEPKVVPPPIVEAKIVEPVAKVVNPTPAVVEAKVVEPRAAEPKVVEPKVVAPTVVEPKFWRARLNHARSPMKARLFTPNHLKSVNQLRQFQVAAAKKRNL